MNRSRLCLGIAGLVLAPALLALSAAAVAPHIRDANATVGTIQQNSQVCFMDLSSVG